jgi:Xaa-Pro aminopeptidase
MIKTKEFTERRNKLFKEIEDNSVVVMYAGVAKKYSEDETLPYTANRNFYYLTNIEQEGSIYLLAKCDGILKEFLFISEYNEVNEKWTGKRLTSDEASKLSGIENVLGLDIFSAKLDMFISGKDKTYGFYTHLYLDLDSELKIGDDLYTVQLANSLSLNYTNIEIRNVYPILMKLRMVKSPQEIEEFKEAISKTNIGLKKIMMSLKPGMFEYQISSLFYYTIQSYDYSTLSFPTICASGVHATVLHYPTPVGRINDGECLQLDLGSKNNGYCADISRVYPVNGKFTELQKKIYNIVLGCNKAVITWIKPGVTIKELQEKTIDFLANGCLNAALIKNKEDIKNYYFHNISHHIGLDTHDISRRDLPLVAGNIISDEPGLYFKELGIGIRIEDDILVTEEGSYNLSGNIIKEISDIEKAMLFRK